MHRNAENDRDAVFLASFENADGKKLAGSALLYGTLITAEEYGRALGVREQQEPGPLAVYVHVPFCPVRCLNCSTNTTTGHDPCRIDAYLDSLTREIAMVAERVGGPRHIKQLHVGGGTPNYLGDAQLVRLMETIERHFIIDDDAETSIEAHPAQASWAQLSLLRGLGFKRIDFGVRDLEPSVQYAIGRVHTGELVEEVVNAAREAGFVCVNTDIAYGLPNQTIDSMTRTVERMIRIAPNRISCLSHARRVREYPHQLAMDWGCAPSLADKVALFNTIVEGLTGSDYEWVGLDCFARRQDDLCTAQHEHRLRRNWIGYTLAAPRELFGFGTSAVSDLDGLCVQNHFDMPHWHSSLNSGAFPIQAGIRMSEGARRYRDAVTDLLCNLESPDTAIFDEHDGLPSRFTEFARDGLLDIDSNRVSVTPHGRYLLHHMWSEMLPSSQWRHHAA